MAVKIFKESQEMERTYSVAFDITVNNINNIELEELLEEKLAEIGELSSYIEVNRKED